MVNNIKTKKKGDYQMETRLFENIGAKVSLLGFGCMRLPTVAGEDGKIDYDAAAAAIDYAYKNGVNYFDTAYGYHSGQSELFIGKALSQYPRDSFFLADKMPPWFVNEKGDVERIFNEQLKKCGVDYFDFYLEHSLNAELYDRLESFDAYSFLSRMKSEGKIRRLGFSFHGDIPTLERILSDHDWDFVQIQYNYLDCAISDAQKEYDIIAAKGIPCIIMEPVRGGALANLCEEANAEFKKARPDSSIASWAIRYAASKPNVMTVLSGMSNMEQVRDNVATVGSFEPLTQAEDEVIDKAVGIFRKYFAVPCTKCRYCTKDCPQGIDIPEMLRIWSKWRLEKNEHSYKENYLKAAPDARASRCIACGSCESFCPQSIGIIEIMNSMKALNEKLGIAE